jgi:small subunit ribosomal protein S26
LDAAIEEALANLVDHNYAIDLEGNIIHGRVGQALPKEAPNTSV